MKLSRFYCGVLVGAIAVWVPIFICEACSAPKAVDCRVEFARHVEAGCGPFDAGSE
jgi:hypothetical protein